MVLAARRRVAPWTMLLVALLGACSSGDPGVQLPEPPLVPLDDTVEAQLRAQRERALEAASSGDPAEAAERIGELGRLHHALEDFEGAAECYATARRFAPEDWRWAYLAGLLAAQRSDTAESIALYSRAVELAPQRPEVLHRAAEAALRRGEATAALDLWQHALDDSPESAALLAGRGRALAALGRLEPAAESLAQAMSLEPEAGRGHQALGLVLRDLGDLDRARRHLARGGGRDFTLPDPLVDGIPSLLRGSKARIEEGLAAVLAGELDQAAAIFRDAATQDPTAVDARRNLALTLRNVGDMAGARQAYARLIQLEPDSASAHLELAQLTAAQGDLEGAMPHFERALHLAPDFKQGRTQFGLALERAGRSADALREYEAALRLDPFRSDVRIRRAAMLVRVGKVGEGLRDLRTLVAERPGDARTWLGLATALRDSGDIGDALATFRRGLERADSSDAAGLGALEKEMGRTLALAGQARAAARALRRATERAPTDPETGLLLGLVLQGLRQFDAAADAFRDTLDRQPQFLPARIGLAESLGSLGRCEDAKEMLRDGLATSTAPALQRLLTLLETNCRDVL